MVTNYIKMSLWVGGLYFLYYYFSSPFVSLLIYLSIFYWGYSVVLFIIALFCPVQVESSISSTQIIKGDTLTLQLGITNPWWIPLPTVRIKIHTNIGVTQKEHLQLSIIPKQSAIEHFEVNCTHRGEYEIQIQSYEIHGNLGLLKRSKQLNQNHTFYVTLPIHLLNDFSEISRKLSGPQNIIGLQEDLSSISEIRKYTYGDPLKKIHWKSSAKKNSWYVKEYDKESEHQVVLLLDIFNTNVHNTEIVDTLLESTLSILYHFVQRKIPIDLIINQEYTKIHSINSEEDFAKLYLQLNIFVDFLSTINYDVFVQNATRRYHYIILCSNKENLKNQYTDNKNILPIEVNPSNVKLGSKNILEACV